MRKKLWIYLALLVVIPGLMFTVSCAKKVTQAEPSAEEATAEAAEPEVDNAARIAAEKAAQDEAARQWEMASEEDLEAAHQRLIMLDPTAPVDIAIASLYYAQQNEFSDLDISRLRQLVEALKSWMPSTEIESP